MNNDSLTLREYIVFLESAKEKLISVPHRGPLFMSEDALQRMVEHLGNAYLNGQITWDWSESRDEDPPIDNTQPF